MPSSGGLGESKPSLQVWVPWAVSQQQVARLFFLAFDSVTIVSVLLGQALVWTLPGSPQHARSNGYLAKETQEDQGGLPGSGFQHANY